MPMTSQVKNRGLGHVLQHLRAGGTAVCAAQMAGPFRNHRYLLRGDDAPDGINFGYCTGKGAVLKGDGRSGK